MVLCKFFLQGNCRFGENCKFEHQLNDNRQQHSSIIRQQNFTTNTSNTNVDTNTLIRAVTNDMMTAEKGGQWLLSCYAPFKEKPNFPGFEEQSFEEVRWGYYEAQRNGNVDQFNQQLQMALQAAAMKIRSLQNPSPDAVNTIKSIYNTTPNPSASTNNNMFGNSNFTNAPANPYGQANYGSQFGQNNQQQTAASKSIFAVANQKLFGPQQHSNSIFGGQPGQSIFANAPMSGGDAFSQAQPFANQNPFGMQQNVAYSAQPFVQQQQQQQTFDMQQQNVSPFGVAQPQTNSPLFVGGGQQQNAPFGTQPQAAAAQQLFPSPYTAQPIAMQQPFAPQQQQFAAQPPATTNTPFAPSTTNIFSGTSSMHSIHPSPSVMFPNGAGQDQSAYSNLEELSESDIKAYESDNFEFGKIPEKPPTIQMCF